MSNTIKELSPNTKIFFIYSGFFMLIIIISSIYLLFQDIKSTNNYIEGKDYRVIERHGAIPNTPLLNRIDLFSKKGLSINLILKMKSILEAYYANYNRHSNEKITEIDFSEVNYSIDDSEQKKRIIIYTSKLILNKNSSKTNYFKLSIFGIDDLPKIEIGPDEKSLKTIFNPEK